MIARRILVLISSLGMIAAARPAPVDAPKHAGPTSVSAAARANWIFEDCLKRYKDHAGCRYLAYHRRR